MAASEVDSSTLLREHRSGLFPEGQVGDPSRFVLTAGAKLTRRAYVAREERVYEQVHDTYLLEVHLRDAATYTHALPAGMMQIVVKGPESGLVLQHFYSYQAAWDPHADVWEVLNKHGIDPKGFMMPVLRAFLQTHLVQHLIVSEDAPRGWEAFPLKELACACGKADAIVQIIG